MQVRRTPYVRRVDAVRVILMIVLILSIYRLPFKSGTVLSVIGSYFSILCGFAPCALFALYGYYALKPGKSLKKNILHTLTAFLITLVVYTGLGCLYQWLYYGNAFSWINIPSLLTFLVFNLWPINVGESIWILQTVLYALLIFALFKKLSDKWIVDCIVCAVLMIAGIVFGELAFFLDMPFYVERNFLTMTIPYMLLGKLLSALPRWIKSLSSKILIFLFVGGIVLCFAEIYALLRTGTAAYYGHLIGFIPMSAVIVIRAARGPKKPALDDDDKRLSIMYRSMYYLYNPIAEFYFLLSILLIGFPKVFETVAEFTSVATVVLTFFIALLIARIIVPKAKQPKKPKQPHVIHAPSYKDALEDNAYSDTVQADGTKTDNSGSAPANDSTHYHKN